MENQKEVEFAIIQTKEAMNPVSKQSEIIEFVALILDPNCKCRKVIKFIKGKIRKGQVKNPERKTVNFNSLTDSWNYFIDQLTMETKIVVWNTDEGVCVGEVKRRVGDAHMFEFLYLHELTDIMTIHSDVNTDTLEDAAKSLGLVCKDDRLSDTCYKARLEKRVFTKVYKAANYGISAKYKQLEDNSSRYAISKWEYVRRRVPYGKMRKESHYERSILSGAP